MIVPVLMPNRSIKLCSASIRSGMAKTKYGYFNVPNYSTYGWPNGVEGGFAYVKTGALLPPNFVRASMRLKQKGIKDIDEVEAKLAEGHNEKIDMDEVVV
jgi:hypothetical protein